MLKQLINLFIKKNGRSPNALEMLQLKFKAAQQSGKGKVIPFPEERITDWTKSRSTVDDIADDKVVEQMYRTSGPRSLDEDKMYLAEFIAEDAGKVLDDLPIAEQNKFIKRAENALRRNVKQYQEKPGKSAGITNIGKKTETAKKMDEDKFVADFMANADRIYYKFVNETLVKVQNASKDEQLEIAKDIINRKGMYRNLDEKDSAKILKSIDQNIKPVEPKAGGGVAGLLGERTGFQTGGSPAIDPRMLNTYEENKAANKAQAAANYAARFGEQPAAQAPGILSQAGTAAKNLATVPANFLKAFFGDVSNPGGLTEATLTQSQKNYLKQKALEKGGERGSLSYDDYGVNLNLSDISKVVSDPTALSTALTAGGVSYNIPKVGPQTGEPQFTGLTYDWDGALPFIDKGGVMGMASRGVEKVSDLLTPTTAAAAEVTPTGSGVGRLNIDGTLVQVGIDEATGFPEWLELDKAAALGIYPNMDYSGKTLDRSNLADGGLAPLLGEPTYQDDNHRVPLSGGGIQVLDPDFDEDIDIDTLIKEIIRSTQERWRYKYQTGGRIGFKNGSKMSRRTFLKGLGALAALPVVGKFFKFAKPAAKVADLTSVPIKNAEGMPSWFKPLVNRVIKEGDDITKLPPNKGGAYAERQIVHEKKLDEFYNMDEGKNQTVRVTQDLDNQTIRVEYQSADNMGGVDDAVRLEYKAAEEIEPILPQHMDPKDPTGFWKPHKAQKTKPTFEANEAWPHLERGEYKHVTFEGNNTVTKVDDLYSDTSPLKQFGTGKALTNKELDIAVKKRNEVNKINNDPSEAQQLIMDDRMPKDFEYATGGRVPFFAGSIAKLGKFSKADVLLQMFENTIKQTKSANTKKRFTNFIKEIKAKPELANDPQVWNFFTKGLPKNQRLVVHSDDTVDFWRQSDFGPHNIKTTDKFMKKHPYLSRDEAIRIQNMEPEDQILEMKRLETIRNRTKNATGGIVDGRVGLLWGGGIWKTIIKNLAKEKGVPPSTYLAVTNYKTLPEEVRKIISKADFEKMKESRIETFENWVEMAKTRKAFLENIERGKKSSAAPIFEHLEKSFKSPVPHGVTDKDILQGEFILKNLKTKGRKLNATGGRVSLSSGGVAGMLGE